MPITTSAAPPARTARAGNGTPTERNARRVSSGRTTFGAPARTSSAAAAKVGATSGSTLER